MMLTRPHLVLGGLLLLMCRLSWAQRETVPTQRTERAPAAADAAAEAAAAAEHDNITNRMVEVNADVDSGNATLNGEGMRDVHGWQTWLANVARAGKRERRGVENNAGFQTAECMTGKEEPKNGLPVARVAIALYGLFRSDCGTINFDSVFKEPLKKSKKYTYVVDVLVHANIAVHEEGDRSHIKGHHTDHTLHVPSLMFLSFNPCKFDVTDQDVVDGYIQPILEKTCLKYGEQSEWISKGEPKCSTTKNYYRALWSQNNVANLIKQHEKKSGIRYDAIVVARPDVMFTAPMKVDHFDKVVANSQSAVPTQTLFIPAWASWHGYNDRFMMGHGGPVLHAMQRIDGLVAFADNGADLHHVHAERYMAWTVNGYFDKIRKEGKKVAFEKTNEVQFRRVRADGALVPNQYYPKGKNAALSKKEGSTGSIHVWKYCDEGKLAEMFPVTGQEKVTRMQKRGGAQGDAAKIVSTVEDGGRVVELESKLADLQDQMSQSKRGTFLKVRKIPKTETVTADSNPSTMNFSLISALIGGCVVFFLLSLRKRK